MISLLTILGIMGMIIYLTKKGYSLVTSLFIGAVLLSIASFRVTSIPGIMFKTIANKDTLELLLAVSLIQILGYCLEHTGRMEKLIETLYALISNLRFQLLMIPSIIGLIPGPGVVMLSAPLIEKTAEDRISADLKSYINYWFRAAVQFSFPISFSFIITISFVEINPLHLFLMQLPITIVMLIVGYFFELKKVPKTIELHTDTDCSKGDTFKNLLSLLRRIDFLVVMLTFTLVFNLAFYVAVIIAILLVAIQEKIDLKQLFSLCVKGFSKNLFFLILAMMFFKTAVVETSTIDNIGSWWATTSMPLEILLFIMPILIGIVTGAYGSAAALSFSLLTPVIMSNNLGLFYVAIVYSLSKIGVMLSSINVSILLTANYFGANPNKVYRKIYRSVPSIIIMVVITYLLGVLMERVTLFY